MKARAVLVWLAFAVALAAGPVAQAQDYPNRLIKLMHGFPPGGNVDVVARLLANEMGKGLGQSIVVEGKPGQAGSLAAETFASTEPDGYTLLLVTGAHPATGAVYKKLKYRPVDDFAWISTAAFYPFVVCVRKDSELKTLSDLVQAARARPGGITSGTAGLGSIAHMTTELISAQGGVQLLPVPYRGEAPAMTGLLSGDVNFVVATSTLAVLSMGLCRVQALGRTKFLSICWKHGLNGT